MEKPSARPRSSYSVSSRSNTYGSQVTPDSPRTKLKSGYFSQAPEAKSDTSTSIVLSWNNAERTSRHWVKYFFPISGGRRARCLEAGRVERDRETALGRRLPQGVP